MQPAVDRVAHPIVPIVAVDALALLPGADAADGPQPFEPEGPGVGRIVAPLKKEGGEPGDGGALENPPCRGAALGVGNARLGVMSGLSRIHSGPRMVCLYITVKLRLTNRSTRSR